MSDKHTCFVAMPLHGPFGAHVEAAHNFYMPCVPGSGHKLILRNNSNSVLPFNFNTLWAEAWRVRQEHAVDRFAMIHGDVVPQEFWLSRLMGEMDRLGADVVSAVIPIKDGYGTTSTGLRYPKRRWVPPRRLTMTELLTTGLPETFCHQDLVKAGLSQGDPADEVFLVNTGLMLVDFTRPWVEDVCFRQETFMRKIRSPEDGRTLLQPWMMSEDWCFSTDLAGWGAKVYATLAAEVSHVGETHYPNSRVWGEWKCDEQFVAFCAREAEESRREDAGAN